MSIVENLSNFYGSLRVAKRRLPLPPDRLGKIECAVDVHDRTQFEIDLNMPLSGIGDLSNARGERSYHLNIYMFLPPQLRFGKSQYSRDVFYQDLRSNVRVREPKLKFKQMLGVDSRPGTVSPLFRLSLMTEEAEAKARLAGAKGEFDPAAMLREAQMFACCFYGFVARKLRKLSRQMLTINSVERSEEWLAEVLRLISQVVEVLSHWRRLYGRIQGLIIDDAAVRREFGFVDEYCSYLISEKLTEALSGILSSSAVKQSSDYKAAVRRLTAALRCERWYGRKSGYLFMGDQGDAAELERIYYRRRVLRRHIWSVLFVENIPRRLANFRRQLGPMTAAFLAAIWAGVANFALIWWQHEPQRSGLSGALVGLNGFLLLILSAIAYILKDRIKEFGRHYFSYGLIGGRFDRSFALETGQDFGQRLVLGTLSESASLRSVADLPAHIRDAYQSRSLETHPLNSHYGIMLHRREIEVSSNLDAHHSVVSSGLRESCRYNIERFLPQLDDPIKRVMGFVGKGELREFELPKVYYVDVLIESISVLGKVAETQLQHFRLTLTKSGLLPRVEQFSVEPCLSADEGAMHPEIAKQQYQSV
jgi:hypothetical protein